ncbi:MAG: serine protease [Acidobacteria bacterium]|nr:serine protease [Acidobacteriota bacterium]
MAAWSQLSSDISQAVEQTGKSIVTVGGRGRPRSGIILDESTVVTAAHAIQEEENIRVWISPETPLRASLKGRDSATDIAVVATETKIPEAVGRPAQFNENPQLSVGQLVVSVARTWRGNVVASSGILSGLMGEWHTAHGRRVDAFIRPDLLLYRGFSGGALIGADRKIIGMITAFLRRGSPLAVPYATIRRITAVLVEKGYIPRPYLGLGLQPVRVPESLKQKLNLSENAGALVVHVEPAGPADQGGVLVGDILLTIGEGRFGEERTTAILSRLSPGQSANVRAIRGGQLSSCQLNVGERRNR